MSLKSKIQYYLEKNGYMSLRELESLCKSEGRKLSNGERRLRELMAVNPAIKSEKNSAGAIIAYKWLNDAEERVRKWNLQFYKPVEPVKETKQLTIL